MHIQNPLSSESISELRRLLGRSVFTIFCPNLDAAGAHLASWTLSMMLSKDSFLNFSCEWSETPQFLMDSWQISVAEAAYPLNIKRNDSGALIEPCSIKMYGAKPIRRIDIFRFVDREIGEETDEAVTYDKAVLFHCEEGRQFCISCQLNGPGIATYLHFSEDQVVIREMLQDSVLRMTLN